MNREAIKVFVRPHPMLAKETELCQVDTANQQLVFEGRPYKFDGVFGCDVSQSTVFDTCVLPMIASVQKGYNATLFAYGQSGSGKTYTMCGMDEGQAGVIPRVAASLIVNADCEVSLSIFEIYRERVQDLLAPADQEPLDKMQLPRLYDLITTVPLGRSPEKFGAHFRKALSARKVADTKLNDRSTRSHMVTVFHVTHGETLGHLYCVDLSGNEDLRLSGAEGKTGEEARAINLSLFTLSRVVSQQNARMNEGKKQVHVPYRDSVLTTILSESIGGNSMTAFIVNIREHPEFSQRSLRFGQQLRTIRTTPHVNLHLSVEEWRRKCDQLQKRLVRVEMENQILRDYILVEKKLPLPAALGNLGSGFSSITSAHAENLEIEMDDPPVSGLFIQAVEDRVQKPRLREQMEKCMMKIAFLQDKFFTMSNNENISGSSV
jgi:hypothetical protein